MSNIYDNFMRIYGQIKSETLQAEHVRIRLFGAKTDRQIYEKHGVYAEPECNEPFLEPCHLGFKGSFQIWPDRGRSSGSELTLAEIRFSLGMEQHRCQH